MAEIKGRFTFKKLIAWCNEKFKELEIIGYEVFEITRTFPNMDQIEGGASRLTIKFKHTETGNRGYFLCFYTLNQLEQHVMSGYRLILKIQTRQFPSLNNLEIDIIKTITPPIK